MRNPAATPIPQPSPAVSPPMASRPRSRSSHSRPESAAIGSAAGRLHRHDGDSSLAPPRSSRSFSMAE